LRTLRQISSIGAILDRSTKARLKTCTAARGKLMSEAETPVVDFMFGLSPGATAAQGEMVRQAMLDRFPQCTFLFDHRQASFMEDWIMPIIGKPSPEEAVAAMRHPPQLVSAVVEAFRQELHRFRTWKPS
jgi:hypothetical protein